MVDMFNQSNITLACVFIFTLIAIGVYRRRIRSKDQPPGPWGLPFVGYLPFFRKNPPRKCTQLAKTYGDIFCIQLGSWPTIVLNSRAAIREALVEQSDTFSDRPAFFSCKVVNNMRSLGFGSYNARWRLHSKIASTVLREFASPNKPTTEKIIMMEAEKLTEYFLENTHTPFDPHEEIFLAVGSVVYQICCGMDKDCRNDKGYLNLIKNTKMMQEFAGAGNPIDVMPWLRYVIPSKATRFVEILQTLMVSTDAIMKEHIETFDQKNLRDVADGLIFAEKKYCRNPTKNQEITKSDIFSTLQDFLGAGFDTSSSTLEWIILYLGHYQQIQEKIQKEIDSVIGTRSVSLDDIGKLPFTEATILETQRISPVVPIGIPHATSKDTVLRNYRIKRGTVVLCNFYGTTRDSKVWKDPEIFKPERFLNDLGFINSSLENELLTFGVGRRRCPGDFIAKMELFLFLVNIFQKCKIKLISEANFEGIFGLTYSPRSYTIKVFER